MTAPACDDYEDEESPIEAGPGAVATAGGADVLGDALLELYGAVRKLQVLVSEVDEDEFRVIRPRLDLLKGAVADLPDSVQPKRRVGFRVVAGRRKVTKKRGRK